ncbi:MAG: biotin/lipoyl-containing protein [Armatimonadota bacterium]|nr:biotin/lipoyl-containing protein [Armatimonadota bacterium]MDR7444269.1 biotin/lipoyl-containing protein [Armatimonadota bacterium]MDR7570904.1 biotin/lipoyl-containing protein [Armatimonadota bacterium]MDR7614197.1 biotin/lipoyl-containing protein [Armatimonadota bacterium]
MTRQRLVLRWRHRLVEAEVVEASSSWRVRLGDRTISVSIRPLGPHVYAITVDGRRGIAHFAAEADAYHLHLDGNTYTISRGGLGAGGPGGPDPADVRAPMPGVVTRILVRTGQVVEAGEPLYVLEAMKMETVVRAPVRARVVEIRAERDSQVEGGATVVELEGLP